ncbi:MAG: phage minor head protein [Alphaproteobacteria bacterium]|nr:phage minor head protein [Alphaproteobacteria bacterium]
MPRPSMDMRGLEYQAILRGRDMYRRYGRDYKNMAWAEDTLDRLEKKLSHGDFTDQDCADLERAREIYERVFAKTAHTPPPHAASGQDGHITTHYIWRTQDDGKVRGSHAANNGKVFAWNTRPSMGHPGEDFNCRCWAEPVPDRLEERKSQVVTSAAHDEWPSWGNTGLAFHYRFGKGKPVTLSEIGHLKDVVSCAESHIQGEKGGGTVFQRVERKILAEARRKGHGKFISSFGSSYDFRSAVWSFGNATTKGNATVYVVPKAGFLTVTAKVIYVFL